MSKTFQKMSQLNDDTLMIVDSLNLAFRWKHKGQLEFVDDFLRTIESLRKSYGAKYVVIASDWGSSSYRKNLYPAYKGNREELRAEQTPEDEKLFELFLEEFARVIEMYQECDDYPVFRFKKVEADDVAGLIVKTAAQYPKIKKIVLISSDRDWDLLVQSTDKLEVMRFSYVTTKEVRADNYNEHYEWQPEDYISIKCLQGDSGDNVPGVDKIGPKTAMKLIQQYGTTYDIAANLPLPGKYVYIKNLNEFGADALMLNYKLMDLLEFCDEAVGPENCQVVHETLTKYLNA